MPASSNFTMARPIARSRLGGHYNLPYMRSKIRTIARALRAPPAPPVTRTEDAREYLELLRGRLDLAHRASLAAPPKSPSRGSRGGYPTPSTASNLLVSADTEVGDEADERDLRMRPRAPPAGRRGGRLHDGAHPKKTSGQSDLRSHGAPHLVVVDATAGTRDFPDQHPCEQPGWLSGVRR
jgi:hypothetical protein